MPLKNYVLFFFYVVHPWRPHSQDLWLLLEPQRALGHLLSVWGQYYASLANGKWAWTTFFFTPAGSKELDFWSSHCIIVEGLFEIATCAGTCIGQQQLGASASRLIPKQAVEQNSDWNFQTKVCAMGFPPKPEIYSRKAETPPPSFLFFFLNWILGTFLWEPCREAQDREVENGKFMRPSCLLTLLVFLFCFVFIMIIENHVSARGRITNAYSPHTQAENIYNDEDPEGTTDPEATA